MYGSIRRSAYHHDLDASPWTARYRAMAFPEHWHGDLLALCNHGRNEEKHWATVPTGRLDGVLQTLAPDLVVRPRPRPPVGDGPPPEQDYWLYVPDSVPDPLPPPVMARLLDAWLRTLGPKDAENDPGFRRQLLAASAELRSSLPAWREGTGDLEVDLLGTPVTEGGTAAPSGRQFQLATDALARRILDLPPYEFDGGLLRFRAVPRRPNEQGAELVSQPLCRTVKRKEWWFSIVLNVTLQTTPFDPRPRLHLHWRVRRWATHPRQKTGRLALPYGQATSVYLRPAVPWLPGAPLSERFAVARLVRPRGSGTYDWLHNDAAGILRRLSLQGQFPAVDELLGDPAAWIGEGPQVQAAVVHSTRNTSGHEIGTGLMPHQRSELTRWAEAALPEGVVRVPDLSRRGVQTAKPSNARRKLTGNEKVTEERRAADMRRRTLAAVSAPGAERAVPAGMPSSSEKPVVEARLLWRTAQLRRSAVQAFAEVLGLAPAEEAVIERSFEDARPGAAVVLDWSTPELDVRLRCLPLNNGLGEPLALDPAVRGRGSRLAQAVTSRREAARSALKTDGAAQECPGLALVEIDHPSVFRSAGTDPKFALRLGCADAGALTQFVVTPTEEGRVQNMDSVDYRVRNAWLDGLRQLGVRVLPQHTLQERLPGDLRYAALWMVKRRKDGPTRLPKHVPVAVLVTPLSGPEGLALVEGWDDSRREWVPYASFLLNLVQQAEIGPDTFSDDAYSEPALLPAPRDGERPVAPARVTSAARRTNLREQRRSTANFLQRVLYSLQGTPTVLIAHAQNSRTHWPWLQDGRVMRDLIKTGHAPEVRLDDDLRLVRIRGGSTNETAQWWGVADTDEEKNGQPAGFWVLPKHAQATPDQRVFYSATSRPQSQPVSPALDRLATRTTAAGNLVSQAGKGAWNPALTEITVLGSHAQSGDDPEAIAMAMHQLRQSPDYADALSLPLPLHLARLAQAYVLPMMAEDGAAPFVTSDSGVPTGLESADEVGASDVEEDDSELVPYPAQDEGEDPEEQLSLF
ncbi:pPIWI_RE module domain-containing protein [Streptomyces sp. NPDC015127]|uniref:pPIWI_RE module domain-containing protein n=1 Tax=Streptomyces sp. NPDC015127 TaxID=3364939 RepID=UPI0036FEFE08